MTPMSSRRRKHSQVDCTEGENEEEKEFVPLRTASLTNNDVKPYYSPSPQESGAPRFPEDSVNENFPPEEEPLAELHAAQIRVSYGIHVEGSDVPAPIISFKDMGLPALVLEELERQGVVDPTPVQMQTIPCTLHGRDVITVAETGSGKSLAYLLPLLMRLKSKPPANTGDGPAALVVVPSRELVDQVYSLAVRFLEVVNDNWDKGNSLPKDTSTGWQSATTTSESLYHHQLPSSLPSSLPSVPASAPLLSPLPLPPLSSISSRLKHPPPALTAVPGAHSHSDVLPPPLFAPSQVPPMTLQSPPAQPLLPPHPPLPAVPPSSIPLVYTRDAVPVNLLFTTCLPATSVDLGLPQAAGISVSSAPVPDVHNKAHSGKSQTAWEPSYPTCDPGFLHAVCSRESVPGSSDFCHRVTPMFQKEYGYAIENNTQMEQENYTPQVCPWRKVLGVVGGVDIFPQILTLKQGVDVLIATPGRLLDLLERKETSLHRVCYLVLDEADKMMGEGMEEQLRKIINLTPEKGCQTLLFTATMPISVERLAISSVTNPITVTTGDPNLTVESVKLEVIFMHSFGKRSKLLQILRSTEFPPVLIFCNSIETVDSVVKLLRSEQFHVAGLHSGKTQAYRFRCMHAFKDGGIDVLVATDVVSRGIDYSEIRRVINYDMPDNIETYIHRCGRTGRMGQQGVATSFLTLECKIAKELRQLLHKTDQLIPQELHNIRQFGGKVMRTEFGDIAMRT